MTIVLDYFFCTIMFFLSIDAVNLILLTFLFGCKSPDCVVGLAILP